MGRQKVYRRVIDEYLTLLEQRVFIALSVGPRFPHWTDQNWPNKGTARFYVCSGAPHVVPFLVMLCEEQGGTKTRSFRSLEDSTIVRVDRVFPTGRVFKLVSS